MSNYTENMLHVFKLSIEVIRFENDHLAIAKKREKSIKRKSLDN
jgi:hypothetical protein